MALDNNTVVNYTDKTTIKNWFKTGLKPTQKQFWSTGDSFWHKSESLPISSISGLGNLLDGKAEENHEHNQYAKNDATSLTADNITAWQQKLGVADLKFDDKAITTTQDYADFGLQAGATINAFNNAIYQSVGNKLDAPTEEGTTTDYPYVVGVNDENEPIKLPAGDLGKNFSNTDLVVYENRKHTGTASVEFGFPFICSNASIRYSGLADKSSDATYNALLGMDNQGNAGKLTALGNVLESGLQTVSSAQALRIGQLLNGGRGSSGTMSVNLVSPPIIQNRFDSVEYVLLRGANLYLDNTNYAIEILDESKTNVVATIPQNQVQLYADGTQLIFYYNFYQFLEGRYFIKLTSGSKVLITTLDLTIVQQVQDINVDNLVWESNYASSEVKNPSTSVEGRNFAITTYKNEDENQTPVISYKTSEIFAQGEDFYIELNLTVSAYIPNTVVGSNMRSYIGLGYSSSPNSLAINSLINVSYRPSDISKYVLYNNSIGVGNKTTPHTSTIIFIKTGNLFRTIVENTNHSTTLSNNSGYSLFINIPKRLKAESINGQITKAFKFN